MQHEVKCLMAASGICIGCLLQTCVLEDKSAHIVQHMSPN